MLKEPLLLRAGKARFSIKTRALFFRILVVGKVFHCPAPISHLYRNLHELYLSSGPDSLSSQELHADH